MVRGAAAQTVTLPATHGRPLVQRLAVAWPEITVEATDFVVNPARAATWVSQDGGATWTGR
jgi:hypothetical protein